MLNLSELLTWNGLQKWLKTVNESYNNKTISEIAGLILNEVKDYKISEKAIYKVFFKNFNLYIQTVKNENKLKLALFEYKDNTLKMIGIVEKDNKQINPSTVTSARKYPVMVWNIPTSSYVYGQEINTASMMTAYEKYNIPGNIIYNFDSLGGVTTPEVGTYNIETTFIPVDYVTYSNGRKYKTLTVKKIIPQVTWSLENPTYINFDDTFSSSSYMTATSNVDGEFEYDFGGLEDGTLTETKDYVVKAIFTPEDLDHNEVVEKSIVFKVRKYPELDVEVGTYTIDVDNTWDGKFTVPVGYYESGSDDSGSVNNDSGSTTGRTAIATYDSNSVAGTFKYYPEEGTVYEFSNFDPSDIQEQYIMYVTASFEPSDTGSYASVSTVIEDEININNTEPEVTEAK